MGVIGNVADPSAPAGADRLARFVQLVLADPAAQAALGAIQRPDVFAAEARAIAAARGIEFAPEDVAAAQRPDPLGRSRLDAAPVTLDRWPTRGWIPARPIRASGAPAFDWAWLGDTPLAEPFYWDSAGRAAARPFSRMFRTRTTLDAVVRGAREETCRAPDGLVFHLSRCGSTLVAQMLAAVPHHIVASEPEPLDAVVQWAATSGAPLAEQVAAMRAIVGAIGRDGAGHARRYFVKVDSWHAMALPLFRAAFPDTPWIFLYRDPIEVMVSQMRLRGLHTVPGVLPAHVFGFPEGEPMSGEQYCAEVLACICAAVLRHWPCGGGMLVNYCELPQAMPRIAAHFGFVPDADETAAMALASSRNSKVPQQAFAADGPSKRAEAGAAMRSAADARLTAVYQQLESERIGRD